MQVCSFLKQTVKQLQVAILAFLVVHAFLSQQWECTTAQWMLKPAKHEADS
jgi:hypothetical protein